MVLTCGLFRLIALAAGIIAWLVISREVVPRLGTRIKQNRVAIWTGALVFLAFWLPYNNGLRPEPVVALGVLLTWCSVERAIATRRLLPAAVAVLIAAFTVTCGPSGIICIAALLAGLRPIVQIWVERGKKVGYAALLLPVIAAGTAAAIPAFADQTLAAMREMSRVHVVAGPNVPWFEEYLRYQYLLNITPDHLDRYDGFAGYAASKARLFAMQSPRREAMYSPASCDLTSTIAQPPRPSVASASSITGSVAAVCTSARLCG